MINVPTQVQFSMRYFISAICFCFVALLSSKVIADDAPISIAVVNVAYLLKNAPEAELASQALKSEFSPREQALQEGQERISKLEDERDRNRTTWSAEQVRQADRNIRSMKRERTRALEDFREELRFARDSALDDVQKSVFQAIEDVRLKRNIDIVIQEYVAASQRVDITTSVLEYLQERLNIKKPETTKTQTDQVK